MKTSLVARSLVGLLIVAAASGSAQQPQTFVATLTGKDATPPVNTNALGTATLMIQNGTLKYKLEVGSIKQVTGACIHLDTPKKGPVAITLYTGPEIGELTGVLASGALKPEDLGGMTLPELLSSIREGKAYVSVHTASYPGGEIQGKLAVANAPRSAGG